MAGVVELGVYFEFAEVNLFDMFRWLIENRTSFVLLCSSLG